MAVEQVVAEHERAALAFDKILADEERLREAFGAGLLGVLQLKPHFAAVAQQFLEHRQIARRGDDENLADARQHQHRERIVDHRLVVDRQHLLGDDLRHRMQPGAGAAGQNDAAHEFPAIGRRRAGRPLS